MLLSKHCVIGSFALRMPLCVGYLSEPCPLEVIIGVGRERCRHCKRLSLMDYQPEEGFQWCPGNCGTIIKSTRSYCRPCLSSTMTHGPINDFIRCVGDGDGNPCSNSTYVLKKNERCKQCQERIERKLFLVFSKRKALSMQWLL